MGSFLFDDTDSMIAKTELLYLQTMEIKSMTAECEADGQI